MKGFWKKAWYFIWKDDSLLSWIANVIIAFLLVKFVVYPLLGLLLGTGFPVVAVISSSMEHHGIGFEEWWEQNQGWYEENDIPKEGMASYPFRNGFNKGDIMILTGIKPEKAEVGQVMVYHSDNYKYPIIHRVTHIEKSEIGYVFTTKGDNNPVADPAPVNPDQIIGRARVRVPWLGWVKILFAEITGGT